MILEVFSNLKDSVLLWFDCYLGWHCENEPYHAMQGFRGDHLHKGDVGKETDIPVLKSIKAKVYIKNSSSLFPPLKLGSPIPHSKISANSTEHSCSIPTHVSFADTNWKQGPWQNGLHWEKENISVIVMLIEDAIVRLEGEGRGGLYVCTSFDLSMVLPYIFYLWKRKMVFFFFSNYLDNAKKEESGKCFRLSTVKRKLNLS